MLSEEATRQGPTSHAAWPGTADQTAAAEEEPTYTQAARELKDRYVMQSNVKQRIMRAYTDGWLIFFVQCTAQNRV